VDLMLVILPFEEKWYRSRGVRAYYVGNPSAALKRSTITTTEDAPGLERKAGPPVVALLPGSRRKEVERIFPLQLDAARYVADRCPVRFWVAQAPAIAKDDLAARYENWIGQGNPTLPLEIQKDGADQILAQAHCAIIKSGTSTLQALIYQVPFAMVYRMSPASWYLTKPLVRTDTYCLANLIAGKRIVPEFVQAGASGANIGAFIVRLLRDEDEHEKVKGDLRMASKNLGNENAYLEGARYVTRLLRGKGWQ
jgi:lipid-A-disaccharide synthase